ncbi:MAG TPA: glycosyltransferase family 2 protein [Dehalococcoidia bacterium]|nr:glycosyltransferase family 2 protein [Dehalococcoidia bacterium]
MRAVAIIPALNEAGAIGAVVRALPRDLIQRVVVVDNGSRDGTAAAARAAGADVVIEWRRGYGFACMAGVAAAPEADVFLFLDGDGSDFAEDAGPLLTPVLDGRADLVLGSRTRGGTAAAGLPLQARAGNRLAAWLICRLDGVCISDLAPFKAVRAEALRSLALRERTYGWTIELIVRAAQRGLRIEEVPARYRARLAGQSKVSGTVSGTLRASVRILLTLARLHWPWRGQRGGPAPGARFASNRWRAIAAAGAGMARCAAASLRGRRGAGG